MGTTCQVRCNVTSVADDASCLFGDLEIDLIFQGFFWTQVENTSPWHTGINPNDDGLSWEFSVFVSMRGVLSQVWNMTRFMEGHLQELWSPRLYSIQHEKSPVQDAARIHRLIVFSSFSVWWCISVLGVFFVFFIPSILDIYSQVHRLKYDCLVTFLHRILEGPVFKSISVNYVFHAVSVFNFFGFFQCSYSVKNYPNWFFTHLHFFGINLVFRFLWKSNQCITLQGCSFPDNNYEAHYKTTVCQELSRITLHRGFPRNQPEPMLQNFLACNITIDWYVLLHTPCVVEVQLLVKSFVGSPNHYRSLSRVDVDCCPMFFFNHVPSCFHSSLSLLSSPLFWVVVCVLLFSCCLVMLCVVV